MEVQYQQNYFPDNYNPPRTWILELNQYQRNNLLLLLNICGYNSKYPGIDPFTFMNNGDWLGEICIRLADKNGNYTIEDSDQTNTKIPTIYNYIRMWLEEVKKKNP